MSANLSPPKDMHKDRERTLSRKRRVEKLLDAALDVAPEEPTVLSEHASAGNEEWRRVVKALELERGENSGCR